MKNLKTITSAIAAFLMVCTGTGAMSILAGAEENAETTYLYMTSGQKISFSTNENGTTYTLDGKTSEYKTIKLCGTIDDGFTVESGIQNIIFKDVKIKDSVVIKKGATANIEVIEDSEITAKNYNDKWFGFINDYKGKAGINVSEKATLNLSGNAKLITKGSDEGDQDGGAGIGGNCSQNAGDINIYDNIFVCAYGGKNAAGIGGGYNGNGGNITIRDGAKVVADGYGDDGAGIGGGYDGNGGNITISDAKVYALGGESAAAIGGGYSGDSGKINITNSLVAVEGGENAAAIGGGNGKSRGFRVNWDGICEEVNVTESEVYSVSTKWPGSNMYSADKGTMEPIGGGADEFGSGKVTINGKLLNKKERNTYKTYRYAKINKDGSVNEMDCDCLKGFLGQYSEIDNTDGTKSAVITLEDSYTGLTIKKSDNGDSIYLKLTDGCLENLFWCDNNVKEIIIKTVKENKAGIKVEKGDYNLVLEDVKLKNSIVLDDNAQVNMELRGENTVMSALNHGIIIPETSKLNLFGDGKLTVTGGEDKKAIFGIFSVTKNGKEFTDYETETVGDIETLEIDLTKPEKETEQPGPSEPKLAGSFLSADDGVIYTDITSQYLSSTTFISAENLKFAVNEGYSYKISQYKENNKTAFIKISKNWENKEFSKDMLDSNCKFIRIMIKKDNNEKITAQDKTGFTVNGKSFALKNAIMLDDGLVYDSKVNLTRLSDEQYFKIGEIEKVSIGNNYEYCIAFYNDGEGDTKKFECVTDWLSNPIKFNDKFKYFRVTIRKADGSNITAEDDTGLQLIKK